MAIQYIPKFQEYIGLSTDDKTSLTEPNAVIYYTDTKKREIFHNGTWSEYIVNINDVEINKVLSGEAVLAIDEVDVTTTSEIVNTPGFTSYLIFITLTGTGTWKIDVQWVSPIKGTVMNAYDGSSQASSGNITQSRGILVRGNKQLQISYKKL